MSYGITTARAHLDAVDPSTLATGEIDWFTLAEWVNSQSQSPLPVPPPPAFAGRYFLGRQTQGEADAGVGFCLWAHGEGVDLSAPRVIVPLQRADPDRQSAHGDEGLWFGYQDAIALASYIDRCLAVGDLAILGTQQILVFLEVADGTALSDEYWASWASALHEALLFPVRPLTDSIQPLVPGIQCAFVWDEATGTFLPEPSVRAGLDMIASPGFRNQCHGLWARRREDDNGVHVFGWESIGEYRQPQRVAGLAIPYMRRVPVRFLRTFHRLTGAETIDAATRDTLSLVTVDVPAAEGDDSPIGATLTALEWATNRRSANGSLIEMPKQFGIDAAATISETSAACLSAKNVTVTSLPYRSGGTPVNLTGPCRLALRYYRPSGTRRLSRAEAQGLSRNRIEIGAIWQHSASLDQGWEEYVLDLIEPFVNHRGQADGRTAFKYAAETVNQQPYTPVYFSIDFPVGHPGYTNNQPGSVPVPTPSLETILTYFRDVHRGYREYLATHPNQPYYVGVYTQPDTAEALYRAGLASHFWQPPWGVRSPFPHLNVWQIGMFNTAQVSQDNQSLQSCRPSGEDPGEFWVDIDVAWGDPGSFVVLV